ncbi:MAG TPA: esterase-like activity of phytase family protein [Methylomirabilota bacterium]|nr:esterase-like activity of phytase family protein [Methylomirabilota bacterium]
MTRTIARGLVAAALLSATSLTAPAAEVFNRIAAFPAHLNAPEPGSESVAEIITASEDGMLLVYTDAGQKGVGMIDLTDPASPKAAGFVPLGGEPTSVKIVGGKALVGVVTGESFTEPAGHVATIDLASKAVEATCDLGGQPDSVATSPDKAFLAVAIENERDEDLNDGVIPQLPAGFLAVLPLSASGVDCAGMKIVEMTGLAAVAPEDPEPEFVSINSLNEAVVTLQENNHIAIVDLASATVSAHFSAGSVDLTDIDTERDGKIDLSGSMTGVPREPDGVVWIDDDRFATANEGDYLGGSRGFTIFHKDGTVLHESGASLEHEVVSLGHYPDKRNKKGIEIEGVEAGVYGDDTLLFVASERASVVAVYRDTGAAPELLQFLPSGIGPEGVLAIPSRNLLVTANEADLVEDGGVRAHVMVFARAEGEPAYPTIRSASVDGKPIPFGALSGLSADRTEAGKLYAVTDSFYSAAPRILTVDATTKPATITAATLVTRDGSAAEKLDLEGIATREDGGFWLASEGNPDKEMKDLLLKVSADGSIEEEIALPEAIRSHAKRFGFEGVAVTGSGETETVWIAVQREWGDDPKGMAKILSYTPSSGAWGVMHYPLDTPADGAWVGLSEITALGDDRFAIIERDNQIGAKAVLKALTEVSVAGVTPAEPGSSDIPVLVKKPVRDFMPYLAATNGYVQDKVEGFAIDAAGEAYMVTDNDGVDDASGETIFIRLGRDLASSD